MNAFSLSDAKERLAHRLRVWARGFDLRRRVAVFSGGDEVDALRRIYVINLDGKPKRWRRLKHELDRFRDRHQKPLSTITRRFSAVDAKYLGSPPEAEILRPIFTLADQLTVSPHPPLSNDDKARAHSITMTKQEIAVALSHIQVWKLIANGDVPSALVLEDDVIFTRGFASKLQEAWSALTTPDGELNFDLLYLAYQDVQASPTTSAPVVRRRLEPGIWEASGYVLTRDGARKLLDQLPVQGPVDLWLNLQFARLRVFLARKAMIEQRMDEPSTNSYSILPVLSQVGVITREKPLVPTTQRLKGPIIAAGPPGSGLTALAKALSMVGYTCISDIDVLPTDEQRRLRTGAQSALFNAYINVGSLGPEAFGAIASANRRARFIATSAVDGELDRLGDRVLPLPLGVANHWADLATFLEIEYPMFPYPDDEDLGQRKVIGRTSRPSSTRSTDLKFDKSPWILEAPLSKWNGITVELAPAVPALTTAIHWRPGVADSRSTWRLREDTFPSNLALFTGANFVELEDESAATLTLREEATPVREFTSAAIASRQSYLYGSFAAELRPTNVAGLITGMFLHRNGPRQEIDIEFLGKDTTKMLINVYYNPGPDGTKLEYGYRGTPTYVDLGFDAAADFHLYEINWHADAIRWKVDGRLVYERVLWNPTPIPDRPLELHINLWHSRSTELAGRLDVKQLPATVTVRSISLRTIAARGTSEADLESSSGKG